MSLKVRLTQLGLDTGLVDTFTARLGLRCLDRWWDLHHPMLVRRLLIVDYTFVRGSSSVFQAFTHLAATSAFVAF